ncbi:uncharacterized protein [Haliotis cracherodii]|uniref:uncharacterized protein n=1 Tax=Haliotis cracherodii TaxID=6455 RepID=UPI0039E9B935
MASIDQRKSEAAGGQSDSAMDFSSDSTLQGHGKSRKSNAASKDEDGRDLTAFESSCVILPHAENDIEAHRISNNYLFGLKKWKSHVTSRPLSTRSEIVQDLYADINKVKPIKVSTVRPTNIIYACLFGWWLALLYIIISGLMYLTYIGRSYGKFCWMMAWYFFWPFGKFVHQIHDVPLYSVAESSYRDVTFRQHNGTGHISENTALLASDESKNGHHSARKSLLVRPQTYIWCILGIPLLLTVHFIVWFIAWLFVISIPIAKVNSKTMMKILFLPPEEVDVEGSSEMAVDSKKSHSEIIMYTHQSVNLYYYKYTLDGVNVILVNLLIFVLLSLVLGYTDTENKITDGVTKCILGVLAIVPLTYYIGMAITSISAQSSFAIGAILNATFGSMVELILFVIVLKKGKDTNKECFQELVKSSLAGTILASILFIPGVCMIVGGIKYQMQRFNPQSAGVSAALLFVSIAGVFAPTVFSKLYGDLQCKDCEQEIKEMDIVNGSHLSPNGTNVTYGFKCTSCTQSVVGLNGDQSLYQQHIEPLVYSCALVLPVAYIVGLVYTLKTHSSHVYGAFEEELKSNNHGGEGAPQWNRIKSTIILLICAVLIALCSDLITDNIQPLLESSGISEYFVGVTMLAVVPELPEVVNGVQFALQNNVNLGIEIGSSTAIQVCLVQVPILVLINLIYPLGFVLIFQDVHLFAVIFSVIVINYTFQDGKSDYFQGSVVVLIYIVLMLMYFFTITPPDAKC